MQGNTVLVCVTPQVSCEKLISCSHTIAEKENAELKIICVFSKNNCYSPDFDALEILNESAMNFNAELTVHFNDSPAETVAKTAKSLNSPILVVGFPGKRSSGFIKKLHTILPDTPLCMVDDDFTVYKIEKKNKLQDRVCNIK